jgi:hypothetical protein
VTGATIPANGVYLGSANNLSFSAASTLAMTLNSTGLGIGVSPAAKLDVLGNAALTGTSGFKYLYFNFATDINSVRGAKIGKNYDSPYELNIHATTSASGLSNEAAINFYRNNTDISMTLDLSGNLLVGTTSLVTGEKLSVNAGSATGALVKNTGGATFSPLYAWNATTTGDGYFSVFFTEAAATFRGSISYNRAGGLVAYNTTSDYRAKDIIGPVSNSGSLIDSLKVYVGKMKGATIERPMLIAHEAQEVAPYAVTGTKDEVDADGKDKYQQMDVSSFVPLLIAEIQSLRARVQTLEAR